MANRGLNFSFGKTISEEVLTIVKKIPFTTLEIVLMCVGAAAVLAGGAVTAVIIVKKRKKKGNAAE